MVWGKGPSPFFYMWIISCPSTIVEKTTLSLLNFLGTLGENQLSILWFSSVEADISHCSPALDFFFCRQMAICVIPRNTIVQVLWLPFWIWCLLTIIHPKGNQSWIFIGRTDAELKLQYFGHLMQRADSFERPWCWERLKVGGEGDDRGWDGWMASPTQWTWVWVNSRS